MPSPGRPGTRIPPRRPHQRARRPQDRRRRRPDRAARHAHIAREAADAASGLSFPVVLKVLSADILHKSDIGGVRLGVADRAAAETAFDEILAASRSAQPDAAIDGCLVAPMVTGGVENILGVQRDPVFGFIVMFGLGGIFVEALKDLTVRAAPFDEAEARTMIESVAAYPLLTGLRSQPPADLGALALDPVVVTRPHPKTAPTAPSGPTLFPRLLSSAYNRPSETPNRAGRVRRQDHRRQDQTNVHRHLEPQRFRFAYGTIRSPRTCAATSILEQSMKTTACMLRLGIGRRPIVTNIANRVLRSFVCGRSEEMRLLGARTKWADETVHCSAGVLLALSSGMLERRRRLG